MSATLRKIRGEDVFDQPAIASYRNHKVLAATTEETVTTAATIGSSVPPKAVLIMPTETVFVLIGATVAVGVDTTDGTAPMMVRAGDSLLLPIAAGEVLHLISESACHVGLWYYG